MPRNSAKGEKRKRPAGKRISNKGNGPIVVLTRNELELLKEDPLCIKVLVPLFQAMGFREVEFVGWWRSGAR
jgi:hypothetical protein